MANGANSFELVSEQTVKNLMTGETKLFRAAGIDTLADTAFNRKRMEKEIVAGILTGRSNQDIANSLVSVTGMNYRSAIRNSRTCITNAQNTAGRMR